MLRFYYVVLGCLLAILSSSAFSSINVGLVASFDDEQEARSLAYQYGIQALFKRVNTEGGIKGKSLTLEVLNDHANSELATSNAQRLITRKKTIALFGGDTLQTADAIKQVAFREKVPYLSSMTSSPSLYGKVGYVLNLKPSMLHEFDALCRYFTQEKKHRLAVVHARNSIYADLIKQSCLSSVPNVSSFKTFKFGTIRSSIERTHLGLQSLRDYDVVFVGSNGDLAPLLKQINISSISNSYYFLSGIEFRRSVQNVENKRALKFIEYLPVNYLSSKAYSKYKLDLNALSPALQPSKIGFEGYLAASVLTAGLEAVVSPFEIEDPNDLFRLPLSVARKLTGWVQSGSQNTLSRELSNALNVTHTLDLGLGLYLGFDGENNYLDFPLHISEPQLD
ncbi:ABC transporter substrate-binding protein [Marinomonas balearica]|nr:ABC transporter substrate-binding protein [Marinomonas balearica]